ncbi:hypothetical protein [Psychrobacillus glaciei]|uniref:hypothetical protein n=1 Tax=Psychrobacillus glaciei TaxID=2283160 RepID=UPI001CEF5AC1|nr:hypothetical protein [Psychrobacillus glaciei]
MVEQEKIVLTLGQQKEKDKLVKHGMIAANYEIKDNTMLTLVTILAPLLNKLETKDLYNIMPCSAHNCWWGFIFFLEV